MDSCSWTCNSEATGSSRPAQTCGWAAAVDVAEVRVAFRHLSVAQKVACYAPVFWGVNRSQNLLRFIQHLPPLTLTGSRKSGLSFSLLLHFSWPLLFVCVPSVCLYRNNINKIILPCIQWSVSSVLDDGTMTLSSNRLALQLCLCCWFLVKSRSRVQCNFSWFATLPDTLWDLFLS